MIINHNMPALNAHRQLAANNSSVQKSLEKLSSGLKINRAGDDAAGLAISEKMRGQIKGLEMASKNAQDGISLIQTAEGALNETHAILQRMRELAVQSSNDTNTDKDRAELQKETDQLAQEISRISNDTEFNTQNLAGGGFKGTFHIGSNEGQSIELSINAMDAFSLGVARDVTTKTATGAGVVANAKFADEVGKGVTKDAVLSFTYSASGTTTNGSGTQTAGTVADGTVTNATTATTVARNGAISDADAGSYKVVFTDATNFKIQKDDGTGSFSDVAGATGTAGGAAVSIGGANITVAAADTGVYAANDTMDFTITADKTTTADTVTISSDAAGAVDQVVTVDGTSNKFTVTGGEYKGLSFDLSSGTLADLAVTDTVTVGETVSSATAATTGADGKMVKAQAKGGIDISNQKSADAAITTIQSAIDTVSAERSKLGAMQNRLEHTINNLGTSAENMTAAESRIRDVDMAKEMMNFTKNNILSQAAQSMIAQSNQMPQGVLQLLR